MLDGVVATIMKCIPVNNYCSIYVPERTITGSFDEENKTFIDTAGNSYFDIKTSFSISGDAGYAYDNLTELRCLSEDFYAPDFTFLDTYDAYSDESKNYVVLALIDDENLDRVSTIYIDTRQLLDTAREYGMDIIDDQFLILTALCQKFKYCENFDEVLEDICNVTLAGGVPTEKLERTKKVINHYLNRLGETLMIINEEIDFNESLESEEDNSSSVDESLEEFDIEKVYDYVRKNVVGQDEAVYRLVIEIARAFDSGREKDGILITGESGVGKTLALTTLAECLNRPILIVDSTQITIPGYVGKSIEEYLYDLYVNCGGNKSLAEKAIIFFDEIDKKGSEKKSDVSGQGVLNVLLKFLDGTTYDAADSKYNPTNVVKISTNDMLVIASGAFTDVYGSKNSNVIGFGKSSLKEEEPSLDDFITKGMMPKEFMGRFPVVIHFKSLDKEDLLNVLTVSNKSPLKREEKTFENAGARLSVTPAYLDAVASSALKLKTGARGLKRIVSDTTWRPYAKIKSDDSFGEVVLDADTVSDNKVYQLVKKNKNV